MGEKIEVKVRQPSAAERAHTTAHHHERAEQNRREKAAEHGSARQRHETVVARQEVHQQAVSGPEYESAHLEQNDSAANSYTHQDKIHSFNTTMHHVRQNLSKPERQFSKFIHQPLIEKTSEALGKTIARPSGILGASFAASVGLFLIYSVARSAGFQLSGSEMPILLLTGFIGGLFVEWSYKAVRSFIPNKTAD